MRLGLLQRQAGDALELDLLVELRLLQLDLLLLGENALLDLQPRLPAVGELGIDLRPQLDGLLASLDLRFPSQRLRLALGVLDQLAPDPPRLADAGRAEH